MNLLFVESLFDGSMKMKSISNIPNVVISIVRFSKEAADLSVSKVMRYKMSGPHFSWRIPPLCYWTPVLLFAIRCAL